ncbi:MULTISPECIES: cysteine-rich CWC family protein [Bacillus]|uniref:cysteine-rich CWC family protein n=1 Tax=Bacillus TaxID=1386 RepID=UPI00031B0569|nr:MULTISPECIES: cysteine-rich CWC family protein [Bacillus]
MKSKVCPICGAQNRCKIDASDEELCWCVKEKFPNEIFELVPEESIGKQCICQKCLHTYK